MHVIACIVAGHDDAVNFLLRHFRHVHIDQCNKLGFTALMKAAIQGRTRCAKLLLFAGNLLLSYNYFFLSDYLMFYSAQRLHLFHGVLD